MKSFIVLASCYLRFVKNFSKRAIHCTSSCRRDKTSSGQQSAMKPLSNSSITSPHLHTCSGIPRQHPAVPDIYMYTFPFSPSEQSWPKYTVLYNDKENIIACASCCLTGPERNYAATKSECLGIVWALQHFRLYISGPPLSSRTINPYSGYVSPTPATPSSLGGEKRSRNSIYRDHIPARKTPHQRRRPVTPTHNGQNHR